MEYIFTPSSLIRKASTVEGIRHLNHSDNLNHYLEVAEQIAEEWAEDWPEGEGFGSSDGTFALKDFLDTIISMEGHKVFTTFEPYLKIIKK